MGLVGLYHKLVHDFGIIADPLYRLMNKTAKFHLTSELTSKNKKNSCTHSILGFLNETDPFVLYSDESLIGIGAVLSQKQKNRRKSGRLRLKLLQGSEELLGGKT